jgi:hypothetical protein
MSKIEKKEINFARIYQQFGIFAIIIVALIVSAFLSDAFFHSEI